MTQGKDLLLLFVADYFVIYYDFSKFILDRIFEVSLFCVYIFSSINVNM